MRRLLAVNDWMVNINNSGHYYISYKGQFKCIVRGCFVDDAQISFLVVENYMELRSMGQPVLRITK